MALDSQSLEMAKTTVVILNWNGADMLCRYLPSVVQYTTDADIVVADNGSTDQSITMLQTDFPSVRVLALDKNYGFAEGYNRALEQVKTPYTLLLNSDVRVTENWLQPLEQFLDTHSDYVALQPKILKDGADVPTFEHAGAAGGQMDVLGYPFARGRMMDYVEEDHGQYDTICDCFWASGAALMIRTDAYRQAGGLDARYFAHMEEIDLCWRLLCRGGRIACVPRSVVYHLGGGSLQYGSPRKTYLNFRNNLLTLYKNLPLGRFWLLMPVRWIMDYAAAANDLVHGRSANALAIAKARLAFWQMLPSYRTMRKENQRATAILIPDVMSVRSIVFDYYLRGKRK